MRIRNTNRATRRFSPPEADEEVVSFNATGEARVKAHVGEALAEAYPSIDIAEDERQSDADDDTDDE